MCGITASIGTHSIQNVMDGLKQLQNRGYDSAGICSLDDDVFKIHKYASTDKETAIQKIEKEITSSDYTRHTLTIGHTRWATHGGKTDENAHPHIDTTNHFAVVHNGIIENYKEIKEKLVASGYTFISQTDTEVVVNLISHHYSKVADTYSAIKDASDELEGTYALAILSKYDPRKLFFIRKGSPLLIGITDDHAIIASEQRGFCCRVNHYISIDNTDLGYIERTSSGELILKTNNQYKKKDITVGDMKLTPTPYPHWTIREISEQPDAVLRSLCMGGRILDKEHCKLGGLDEYKDELTSIEHLVLLGCGTSYHAALTVAGIFRKICDFHTVSVYDGGAFSLIDLPKHSSKIAIIYISQSGETKDLHRCLEMVRSSNVVNIGVINVVDSLIAREVDCGVYLNAGVENAVASTKAYTCQVVVLHLIAVWFAQQRRIHRMERIRILDDLKQLGNQIDAVIQNVRDECRSIAEYLTEHSSVFMLGKGEHEYTAKEGALKIKEIGYIHAEGYNSSSLKHGTYSIVDVHTPTILLTPNDEHFVRNQGIAAELKSRHAYLIGISDVELDETYDIAIRVPENKTLGAVLHIIPMQLIAYYLSCHRGINPDYPRNLAKVVTVD